MGGRLDQRVQFLVEGLVDGGLRRESLFQPIGQKVWASREDVSADETFRAGQDSARLAVCFRVQKTAFTSSIEATHRLDCGGQEFEILGIREVPGRRRVFEITAVAKVQP